MTYVRSSAATVPRIQRKSKIRIRITITIMTRITSKRRRRKPRVAHLFALVAVSRFGPLARRDCSWASDDFLNPYSCS